MKTSAKIVADTVNFEGARITTFEVCAPRFLLAEVNTHRLIAKSAASSRAIPVKKRIEMTRASPFIPNGFGKNKPGMQATEFVAEESQQHARKVWEDAAYAAAKHAEALAALDVHKQTANRLLEPFVYYAGVMTGTEWENFFFLRLHPDAQPEFRELAELMLEVYKNSRPTSGRYHLPYVREEERALDLTDQFEISAARCARSSYNTFDGKLSTVIADKALCKVLVDSGHLSPFDHPATTDTSVSIVGEDFVPKKFWARPKDHRHLWGWVPARVEIEREKGWVCGRNSYEEIAYYGDYSTRYA